jgi:hypothetical protein
MLLTFPLGVSEFIDRSGTIYRPDGNGQVEAPAVFLGDFLQAGFVPADLIAALVALSGRNTALESADTLVNKALSGDLVFVVTPATLNTAHGDAANRTVAIALKTAAGEVHTWFNAALTTGVAVAKSSENGTVTITSTTLTFVAGVASVVITEGGTWAAADTNTLTIAAATIIGYTVAQKTSVETMT